MPDAEVTMLANAGMSPDMERRAAAVKKQWYGLALGGVLALGLNVGVVAADQPARPVAPSVATGSLPSPYNAVTVEPVAARTRVSVTGFTIVKTVNRPTPVLSQ